MSSGFRTKRDSNQSPQLQLQARKLKFASSKFRYDSFQLANNKGADQTARSAPLLLANTEDRFSCVEAQVMAVICLIATTQADFSLHCFA